MKTMLAVMTAILALCACARAAEQAENPSDVFEILQNDEAGGASDGTLSNAVDTFDGALRKVHSGELSAVRSNLAYNRKRLVELNGEAAAKREYLDSFWQKVAVYFDDLKSKYGQDADSTEYRRAVISLREQYREREAQARAELARIEEDIATTEKRITQLVQREKLAMLEADLRSHDLSQIGAPEKQPTPTRADEAIGAMEDLSKRLHDKRVHALLENVEIRSTVDECWESIVADLAKGK